MIRLKSIAKKLPGVLTTVAVAGLGLANPSAQHSVMVLSCA